MDKKERIYRLSKIYTSQNLTAHNEKLFSKRGSYDDLKRNISLAANYFEEAENGFEAMLKAADDCSEKNGK